MPAALALLAGASVVLAIAAADGPRSTQGHIAMDDGVRIWHRSVGEGAEAVIVPVLVLTSPHFDALARGRRVIYYDPRGRGRSDTGALKNVSVARNLLDLEGLRKALGLQRMALIGYSGFGLEFAMYALEYPDRVTRLVQLAPVPPRLSPWMDARGPAMQARIDKSALAEYERLRDSPPSDAQERCRAHKRAYAPAVSTHPERMNHAVPCSHPTEWPENQAPLWTAFMPSIASVDVRPRLRELKIPRLVVWPERDAIPLEGVKEWLVPDAPVRLLTVRGADHAVYIDRPDIVVPAIDTFLRGQWPADAAR
jgi:proline iminopeptidase